MLLRQKNSLKVLCRKLELNIDDTDPTKYYVCYDFLYDKYVSRLHKSAHFSYSNNAICGCGKLMNIETFLSTKKVVDNDDVDGIFVKGIVFMIVCMLRNSFLSGIPLTEVLLSNHVSETPPALKFMSNNITQSKAKRKDTASAEITKIVLKLTIN
ncbi:hypothetical protein GIB67_007654 [Kingdonia uniflora]|uniref:Uncharacterized protein n=1 Tax=Kingdonia uniflora TaxID=39325 RepID=A0A7J7N1K6_9MAGN|nr:hypothetical protein GIB67_007654 [Kingdonia uniflora]